MTLNNLRNSMEWGLLVALVLGGGSDRPGPEATRRPRANDQSRRARSCGSRRPTGGATRGRSKYRHRPDADSRSEQPELPKHWIGILGGPATPSCEPSSTFPRAKACWCGRSCPRARPPRRDCKTFDILLQANDTELHDMSDLMELVRSEGESGGKITLDVLASRQARNDHDHARGAARDVSPVPSQA